MVSKTLNAISRKVKLIFMLILVCSFFKAYGQQTYTTTGTEFWLGYLEGPDIIDTTSTRLEILITSDANTSGTISIPQQGYVQSFNVVANVTTSVTIPNYMAEHYGGGFFENKGVLIETQNPCAVFALHLDRFTPDAIKVLPVTALGTKYMVSAYQGIDLSTNYSEFLIVATEDATQVVITPSANTSSGQVAGTSYTVQLDRGESFQLQAAEGADDLTGSTIVATPTSGKCKPFAVFSGAMCSYVPLGCPPGDHLWEQNFPTESWGTEYLMAPVSLATNYTYRVMALNNGTNYTIDGGAPQLLNAGQFDEYNFAPDAHCIQADSPICVTQYLEGSDCGVTADPSQVILNASDQMINNITFSTIIDPMFVQDLSVVMETPYTNTLSLDGMPIGAAQFTPFNNCPGYSWAHITILQQGSHTLTSPFGFSAYAYGAGLHQSYAYSLGALITEPTIIDSVICTSDTAVLIAPNGMLNPWWATQSNPNDTIAIGATLILYPPFPNEIYIVTGDDSIVPGCIQTYSYSIDYQPPPAITLTTSKDTVCLYDSIAMNVTLTPSGAYSYNWTPPLAFSDPNSANPVLTPSQSGWYVCNIESTINCVNAADSIYIALYPEPQPLPYNEATFCDLEIPGIVVLDASNPGSTYLWSTGDTTQQITVKTDGTFYVTITSANNCVNVDSIVVNLFCQPQVYVPNSFTPNGDERNDFFRAYGDNIAEFEMFIYNRWGQLIFHTEEIDHAWGGFFEGEPVQQDVYTWKVIYRPRASFNGPLSHTKELIGHVTLIR